MTCAPRLAAAKVSGSVDRLSDYVHLTPAVEGWLTPGRNPFGLYSHREDVDSVAAAFRGGTLEEDGPAEKLGGCTSPHSTDPTTSLFAWVGPPASAAEIIFGAAMQWRRTSGKNPLPGLPCPGSTCAPFRRCLTGRDRAVR